MQKETFNIFGSRNTSLLNENGHSLFLKRLLSPNGEHGLGNFFLKIFMDKILNFPFDETQQWYVEKEMKAGRGSIDLCIHSQDKFIIVENKIGAEDQKSQLYRYWRNRIYGEQSIYDKQHDDERWNLCRLVYLTRDGQEPSNVSLKRPYDSGGKYDNFPSTLPMEKIRCISYKKDISEWIGNCLKAINENEKPRLYSILEQYKEWIDNFL